MTAESLTLSTTVRLNDGRAMPMVGLGVFQSPPGEPTKAAVSFALDHGYRLIDTAMIYANEESTGEGLRASKVPRKDVFVTTKLWNDDQGHAAKGFDTSMGKLALDYLDLYLIHWPEPLRLTAWDEMVKLQKTGRVRSIGVSNFSVANLEELIDHSSVVPAVNQVKFHPFAYDKQLLDYCKKKGIVLEAYSPIARARRLDHGVLVEIGQRVHRTPAQVLLRWGLQHGVVIIPKSVRSERIVENSRLFDFSLSPKDMAALDGLSEVATAR
jgi:diketogulonate reductase-like aldo/keto reductase